ncbi:WD40 repeat-like protein [Fomitiporia mediterranea MF3/22]|uniref:WD40 repeat-like protein n=1 Tax=Fomitiporia mediterranea (strain MF3/22) TaxID=694068 RepID=UPI0004407998|nr:WD40 repeat-like protein [Fomitiporia mediterranea MF3/22]EJD02082.1 WD40 repeat-like protein [Fomitiporia mediterranea MF3/22]
MDNASTATSDKTNYSCDTLPTPRHLHRSTAPSNSRSPSPLPVAANDDAVSSSFEIVTPEEVESHSEVQRLSEAGPAQPSEQAIGPDHSNAPPQPPARKLCVRHQRMADEGTNLKIQKSLDALPVEDRETVNAIWTSFSSSPHSRRLVILRGILTMCCFSQLSMLSEHLHTLIRLDPFSVLPREISLKVLQYLDAISLCRAAQVSKSWSKLADDDVLWRGICEQHIGQKCQKCGWGLPMLERRRKIRVTQTPPADGTSASSFFKRDLENYHSGDEGRPLKRMRSESSEIARASSEPSNLPQFTTEPDHCSTSQMTTRPWKHVYSERLTIERNWRRGRCTVRTLTGHTDGVMCLQFSETLHHPSFPVLITGSYDRTVRVWNLETGTQIRCLRGHSRAVRALQFDEAKLITGSMDNTIRVWNWRSGKCIRVLEGHTEGVVCLNFDSNILASGSVDTTVKIWNFRTGECFTLRGHRDWVNSVQIWDSNAANMESGMCATPMFEPCTSQAEGSSLPDIDPGKMLFSGSDDGSIILWDLTSRASVRTFSGHVGQVQSIKLVYESPPCEEDEMQPRDGSPRDPRSTLPSGLPGFAPASVSIPSPPPPDHPGFDAPVFDPPTGFDPCAYRTSPQSVPPARSYIHDRSPRQRSTSAGSGSIGRKPKPVLISGSLDNTIRVWDVETGKPITTLFGHIEGVWAVACDKLRLVSASHDRTIKVWVREENRCLATLVGHRGAVTCLGLGDDKIVSGSDDGDIRIWNFAV